MNFQIQKIFLSFYLIFSLCFQTKGQHNFAGTDVNATGINLFQNNAWSVLNGASFIPDTNIQIAISTKNYYQISTLNQHSIAIHFSKNSKLKLGTGIDYFNSPAINSSRFVIAGVHKIGIFKLGSSIERLQYFVNEYETEGKWVMSLSGNARFNNKTSVALQVNDLFPSSNLKINQSILLYLGLKYEAFKNLTLLSQLNGYQNEQITLNFATIWKTNKHFNLKFGTNNQLQQYNAGFDLIHKKFCIQYALQWLPTLGYNNNIGLLYQL